VLQRTPAPFLLVVVAVIAVSIIVIKDLTWDIISKFGSIK
jgi:hypothetical protein